MSSLPTLLPPLWDQPFIVNPSVGFDSIGAILLQKDPNSLLMRPIYFVNRVMKPTDRAYSAIEKMVLALMFATRRFGAYLLPQHFVISLLRIPFHTFYSTWMFLLGFLSGLYSCKNLTMQ